MIKNAKPAIRLFGVIALILFALGCSGKMNPSVPDPASDTSGENVSYLDAQNFAGEYSLKLDPDTVSAEIIPGSRNASFDVTKLVPVSVVSIDWDPVDRIWDIVLHLQNPTNYSAYRPWVVFTDLGQQVLLDQDHFVWLYGGWDKPPQRAPLLELDKSSPKLFEKRSSESVHFQLHWPESVSSFLPIDFFIDVSYPSFREQPDIVSIDVQRSSSSSSVITVVGNVLDLQVPPPGVDRMDAWVDLSSLGGPEKCHLDGIETSEVGVCVADIDPTLSGVVTVHAVDWKGWGIEQDYSVSSSSSQVCMQARDVASGLATGKRLHKPLLLRTQSEVDLLWSDLEQASAPPLLHEEEMFVFLSPGLVSRVRESPTRASLRLSCTYLDPDSDGDKLVVEWTYDDTDEDCDDADAELRSPFALFSLPAVQVSDASFEMTRASSTCPDGSCMNYRVLVSGGLSSSINPFVQVCRTQSELDLVWHFMGSPGPVPRLATNEACVVIVEEVTDADGDQASDMLRVHCVHRGSDRVTVDYSSYTPDSSCSSSGVSSQPFTVVGVANPLYGDLDVVRDNPLYRCSGDTCEPMLVQSEGSNSGIQSLYFDVIESSSSLRTFWSLHRPGLAPPDFDFSHGRVLAVLVLGQRPTTGFSVSLDCMSTRVDPTGNTILDVSFTENVPDPATCVVDPVSTSPFVFVEMNSVAFDDWDLKSNTKGFTCD